MTFRVVIYDHKMFIRLATEQFEALKMRRLIVLKIKV